MEDSRSEELSCQSICYPTIYEGDSFFKRHSYVVVVQIHRSFIHSSVICGLITEDHSYVADHSADHMRLGLPTTCGRGGLRVAETANQLGNKHRLSFIHDGALCMTFLHVWRSQIEKMSVWVPLRASGLGGSSLGKGNLPPPSASGRTRSRR
jgi:hypothetical protein